MQARKNFEGLEVGTKHNQWTIIGLPSKSNPKDLRSYYIKCRCNCGIEKDISIYNLQKNKTTKCIKCFNHSKRKPIKIGEVYGDWTVISNPIYTYEENKEKSKVLCRCKCGKEQFMRPERLRGPDCNKCRECFIKSKTLPIFEKIWSRLLAGAVRREYEVTVTLQHLIDLLEKQKYRCALSGVPIHLAESASSHTTGGTSASVDRIDSKLGYIYGNVQWVDKDINITKNNSTDDAFIDMCHKISEHQQNKSVLEKLKNIPMMY